MSHYDAREDLMARLADVTGAVTIADGIATLPDGTALDLRAAALHPDAPPVPPGLRPRRGVDLGCGEASCRDCYEGAR